MSTAASPFLVTPDAFATEEEAVAHLESLGCAVVAADVGPAERGLHWHDFAAITAVVSGSLSGTDEGGVPFECGPGSLLHATAGALHTEQTPGGRFVYGFPGGMPDFSGPVNLDPEDHPSRAS